MMKPSPKVGDWLQANGPRSEIKLRFYSHPPLALLIDDDGPIVGRYESDEYEAEVQPWQYIGPVHLVSQDHDSFVSVLVPHPQDGHLAWLNIWGHGVKYCRIVSENTLADWFREGFRNAFGPESELSDERMILQEMREICWQPGSYPCVLPPQKKKARCK